MGLRKTWDLSEADLVGMADPVELMLDFDELEHNLRCGFETKSPEQKVQEFFHGFTSARWHGWAGPVKLNFVYFGSFEMTEGMARNVAFAIAHSPRLAEFGLRGVSLCSAGADTIIEGALPTLPALSRLSLDWCPLPATVLGSLRKALCRCSNLQAFYLSAPLSKSNTGKSWTGLLQGAEVGIMCDALSHASKLTYLRLHRAFWESDAASTSLGDSLRRLPNLTVLALGQNSLSGPGSKAVASGLQHLTSLEWLDLGRETSFLGTCRSVGTMNHLLTDGASLLAPALSKCVSLKRIDLSEDFIAREDGTCLGRALAACPALEVLSVHSCLVQAEAARALSDYLPQCTRLRDVSFDISIDTKRPKQSLLAIGSSALALQLPSLPALQCVCLGSTSWCDRVGFRALMALVDCNRCPSLTDLEVRAKPLSSAEAKRIAKVLRRNTVLQNLSIYIA
eukprot:3194960-Rhodomonas_salina.1